MSNKMKIKIPAKTVEACDVCKRESSWLTKCKVCARDYCHTCEAIICGCVHQPDICKECADKEKVRAVVEKFVKPISALLKKRDTAMRRASQNDRTERRGSATLENQKPL
jgi:UDP-2,3-diacylglucosamine pyrophosphatase LpxH